MAPPLLPRTLAISLNAILQSLWWALAIFPAYGVFLGLKNELFFRAWIAAALTVLIALVRLRPFSVRS